VPVVLVLTQFDLVVSRVLFDIASGDPQHHERAKFEAQDMVKASCSRLLRNLSRDVPVEIISSTYPSYVR
jgi:hypothetical protein